MTRQTVRQVLATPALAAGCCFTIILIAGMCAEFVPTAWQGNWTDHIVARQPHFIDRFFPFDAVWYQRIATDGYVWDAAQPGLKQDVAFFPLWPLVLRLVAFCTRSVGVARVATVLLSGAFATASIVAFHVLALRLLPQQPARTATFLFALYPGASFLLLSYPTGLMNLLVILALLALLDDRFFVAAALAGLVTAIGPLGLGTALAVSGCAALHAARQSAHRGLARWRCLVWLAGIAALSVGGLIAFLLWQWAVLGDPLAFIKAQAAWAVPLPWAQRIPRAILQALILPDFIAAARELGHATKAHGAVALQASLEKALHLAAEGG
ncbi:MAG TPA: mannosyltransferase family protein, partial [Acetobacteraceae bacterium]|nr:mannosyltransferase family protein [Acetobacteraceae bacterium]